MDMTCQQPPGLHCSQLLCFLEFLPSVLEVEIKKLHASHHLLPKHYVKNKAGVKKLE